MIPLDRIRKVSPVASLHSVAKRVGIVTFHASLNFGSALQAFALQSAISAIGCLPEIIDYRSKDYDNYKMLSLRRPRQTAKTLRRFGRYRARRSSFERFAACRYRLSDEVYGPKNEAALAGLGERYDVFVCGSDQIWNLDCTQGVVEPFFLSFAGDKRRVAYAPSLAHTTFKPENFDKKKVADLLARFDYLSVREGETVPLFQQLVDKRIEVALDPTLLLDADAYADMTNAHIEEQPYIFIYLLRDCSELIESAAEMAAEGAHICYISERDYPIPNSVNLFGVGPEEFVSLIVHADAVLTNSFHATVFSILFHRPFRVFATDKSASRMRDLLGKLGISELCVSHADASPVSNVGWEDVDLLLEELREGSWNYLRRALS